jgi:hypothetical protein
LDIFENLRQIYPYFGISKKAMLMMSSFEDKNQQEKEGLVIIHHNHIFGSP